MKKYIVNLFLILLFVFTNSFSYAQDKDKAPKKDRPVAETFSSSILIENQTIVTTPEKKLELLIQHRMGSIENGMSDLYGMFGASNIRLALQYGVSDIFTIGIGAEKDNKLYDVYAKLLLLEQTRKNVVPFSIAVFGSFGIDSRDEEFFGQGYNIVDRFSLFAQVILAKKFNDNVSLQIAPSFSHYNTVDKDRQHDRLGIMAGGRLKFSDTMGFIFEYHQPIRINELHNYQQDSKPGIAFGLEIATVTHAFQVFVTNYRELQPQTNYVMNTSKFNEEGICIGFNVNVKF